MPCEIKCRKMQHVGGMWWRHNGINLSKMFKACFNVLQLNINRSNPNKSISGKHFWYVSMSKSKVSFNMFPNTKFIIFTFKDLSWHCTLYSRPFKTSQHDEHTPLLINVSIITNKQQWAYIYTYNIKNPTCY